MGTGDPDAPPKASVLMPTYNDGRFVRQAVDSIRGQTFADFEFVIVNDGSTDDTPEILAEYARRDGRIRVLTNDRNMGIFASLNRGLDVCRGEYVVRMDADDIAIADRLERQLAVMDARPDVVALGGALTYIDAAGKDLNVMRRCAVGASLLRRSPMLHPTVVFRRKVVEKHAIRYQGRFRPADDYFFWLELSRFGRLDAIDDVVLN
ncbi:MAG: glycosyltransferase, partial [Phycisphaerae bacterium]